MSSKQSTAAAAAIVAAAVAWITYPKIFVAAALVAATWLSLATCVALAVGRVAAYRNRQVPQDSEVSK